VVDDASDPAEVDFARFPGMGAPGVEAVFTKEGRGAGYARNVGLERARGKWLLFADADDFFLPGAFEALAKYVDSPHDIVFFKTKSCYSEIDCPAERGKEHNSIVDNFIKNKAHSENTVRYYLAHPWAKMIRRDFIEKEKIRFDEVITTNDKMFSVKAGYFARSVGASEQIIYCITDRPGSLSTQLTRDAEWPRYLVMLRVNKFLRDHSKGYCQFSTAGMLARSARFGISSFARYLFLAIAYKNNPFKNWSLARAVKARLPSKTKHKLSPHPRVS